MAETITMPKLGFDMAEGTLVRWVRQEGEQINKGDVLAEIETDKATVEVESHAAGVVLRLLVNQGDVVPVSAPIAIIGAAGEKVEAAPKAADPAQVGAAEVKAGQAKMAEIAPAAMPTASAPVPPAITLPSGAAPVRASPLAKKMALESRLDLTALHGTGPGGRVVRRDIESALANAPEAVQAPVAPALPSFAAGPQADQTVAQTRLRQAIARRMSEAKQSVPHFYLTHEYRMEALLDLRKQVNGILSDDQTISVNDFILKAVALTLRGFPNLNSSFAGDKVVRHGSINMGVAVAVEGGLLTVVCRDADQKPLRQIAMEVKAMAARAREGKVRPDDIEGSTFSLSNLGMFDVENFAAIINPPEAAILAVGSAHETAVVEKGELKVGWRLKATISVDHRVSDGAEAARFMQALADFIQQPLRLLV